jgi:hypothetical protein
MFKKNKMKQTLTWILTGLPLGAVIGTSFLPMAAWMHQALVLIVLLWFFAFYLFDCFYLGG